MRANTHHQNFFFSPTFSRFLFFIFHSIHEILYRGTAFTACSTVLRMHWMLSRMGLSHAHSVLNWSKRTWISVVMTEQRICTFDHCFIMWSKSMLCHCTHVFMFECVYWYKTHSNCYLWNRNVYIALNANPIYVTCSQPAVYTRPLSVWSCQVVMLESVI